MKKWLQWLLLVLAFVGATVPDEAFATTYYVSNCLTGSDAACVAGSDANAGTVSSSPKKTYAAAWTLLRACSPGDQILFAKGSANDQTRAVVTIDPATDQVTWTAHGLSTGDAVEFLNDTVAGQNTFAAPLADQTKYFVKTVVDPNIFTLSVNSGGSTINITAAPVGTVYGYHSGTFGVTHGATYATNSGSPCVVGSYAPAWGAGTAKPIIYGYPGQYATNFGTQASGGVTFQNIDWRGHPSYTSTVTFDSTTDQVHWVGHGLTTYTSIYFSNSGGTMPGGLTGNKLVQLKTVIDADNFTVSNGNGQATINITSNGTGTTTAIAPAKGLTWLHNGAQFISFDANAISTWEAAALLSDSTTTAGVTHDIEFTNNTIDHVYGVALGGYGPSNVLIEGNTCDYCGDNNALNHAIYLSGTDYISTRGASYGLVVRGNTLTNSSKDPTGVCTGVTIVGHSSSIGSIYENNYVYEAVSGGGCYGIDISPANGSVTETSWGIVARGNTIINAGLRGISLGGCTDCVIESNLVAWLANMDGASGLVSETNSLIRPPAGTNARLKIRNNTVYLQGSSGAGSNGVFLYNDGSAHEVTNNALIFGAGTNTNAACIATPAPQVVTITNANPGVVSFTTHQNPIGQPLDFTTTGSISGLPAGRYYVASTGWTQNVYTLALTAGGAAIDTTGTQAGTHTMTAPITPLIGTAEANACYHYTTWHPRYATRALFNAATALDTTSIGTTTLADALIDLPTSCGASLTVTCRMALQAASPLIHTGSSAGKATRDALFRVRGALPDIGGYQRGASASTVPPASPTGGR